MNKKGKENKVVETPSEPDSAWESVIKVRKGDDKCIPLEEISNGRVALKSMGEFPLIYNTLI